MMTLAVDRYGVMGNPIAHSKSPWIHQRFAEQTGQSLSYEAILVAHGTFPNAVQAFADGGGKGLNVTVPFKQEAWQLATLRSERAERAGAVNTLSFADGVIRGDNTDGIGLLHDLQQNLHCPLTGRRILILGAGGAVRGILQPLLAADPEVLVIANRTAAKAEVLASAFADLGPISAVGLADLEQHTFDLVINGTSASLQGDSLTLPPNILAADCWCYDLVYSRQPTPFMNWSWHHGARNVVDGSGMLVEQAAESFRWWRGVAPQTAAIITALQEEDM